MTRIEELRAELEREVTTAAKPLAELRTAAAQMFLLAQDLRRETDWLNGVPINDADLEKTAAVARGLLFFLNERTLRAWNEAVRGFLASALVDSLGDGAIVCPNKQHHLRDHECRICGELLEVTSGGGAGGAASGGNIVVEVTTR